MGDPRHLVTTFGNQVLPQVLVDGKRKGERLIIANTGTLRFDLVGLYSLLYANQALYRRRYRGGAGPDVCVGDR